MRNEIGSSIHAYWDGLRRGRLLPRRTELNPVAIESALAHLVVAERRVDGPARIRIGGIRLCDMAGGSVRALPLRALWRVEEQERIERLIDTVFTGPSILDLTCNASANGVVERRAAVTLLPLSDEGGACTRLFGSITVDGPALPRSGLQLSILRERVTPVRMPTEDYGFEDAQRQTTLAEEPRPFLVAIEGDGGQRSQTEPRRPRLVLHHGGKR
ncbi:MAG: PAS domain-containing protein [Rubricella sp.]